MILIAMISIASPSVFSQDIDTTFIRSYEKDVMVRALLSRKYTNFNFRNSKDKFNLKYSPNNGFNLGVGGSYKWATVNLTYGFDFLNPYKSRGDTRTIDLQLHGYGQRLTIDFLGQFYKGFYLPKNQLMKADNNFYLRPDLSVNTVGTTLQYIFNNKRFSYRAAFLQNALQKKSAGSLLIGLEIYGGRVSADSSIVPKAIQQADAISDVNKIYFVELGPNVGYAYTWVYKQNFYVTGAASVSINSGYNRYYENEERRSVAGISPNTLFRISSGYTIQQWNFNLLYVTTGLYLIGEEDDNIAVNTGQLKFNINYRFSPSRKVKKYLKPIDEVSETIESIQKK